MGDISSIGGLRDFITTQNIPIPGWDFVINLVLAAILAAILGYVYQRYGHALSNRQLFARNFIVLAMTTMVIIAIVKSSLALSLGLVGALSIVRFRAAIKEPEELTYLFLVISIGLGLGADQRGITLVAFAVILLVIWLSNLWRRRDNSQSLHLTVVSQHPQSVSVTSIAETLKRYCRSVDLKRFDENSQLVEASFTIHCDNFQALTLSQAALREVDPGIQITFLDSRGIG